MRSSLRHPLLGSARRCREISCGPRKRDTKLRRVSRRSGVFAAVAIGLATVLVVSLAWGLQHAALAHPSLLGKAGPRLALETPYREQERVWQLQGKPVVVNFLASWWSRCIDAM